MSRAPQDYVRNNLLRIAKLQEVLHGQLVADRRKLAANAAELAVLVRERIEFGRLPAPDLERLARLRAEQAELRRGANRTALAIQMLTAEAERLNCSNGPD